ncbi:hypothetical protein P4576_15010 [Peribacillus frigoritolerans]|uniref:hypothetical protein n=1 Tax=Peribacillus frigoritolerans TaxID=450367 RepID=UPI002E22EB1D|nr:hypothetical protein [Peribacillus frigoritolerans]
MEIMIKESDDTLMPYGHVFSANINSAYEALRLFDYFQGSTGKPWNRIFFKLKSDAQWMLLCEFIRQNFSDEEYMQGYPETEYLGMEYEDGEIKKKDFPIQQNVCQIQS